MRKIDLVQSVTIVANLGVIAGIFFLSYELRQNTVATRLGVVQNYSENLAALHYFVAADESLSVLIAQVLEDLDSFDTLDPSGQLRLRNFWLARLREWESAYDLFFVSDLAGDLSSSLRGQIETILALYPADRPGPIAVWQFNRSGFSNSFNTFFEEIAVEQGLP